VEVKHLFFTTPKVEIFSKSKEKEVGEETEANGGHWGDRTLNRTRSWYDRTRPVNGSSCVWRGALGFVTGASGHSWGHRVWSGAQRDNSKRGVDRTWWRVRSRSIGRVRSCVDAYWTQTGCRCNVSDQFYSASGRCFASTGVVRSARLVKFSSASGRLVTIRALSRSLRSSVQR
jgi:hypothetical protein